MYYHLFFYLIWKVVKKHKTFFWESGVRYNLSGSVYVWVRLHMDPFISGQETRFTLLQHWAITPTLFNFIYHEFKLF